MDLSLNTQTFRDAPGQMDGAAERQRKDREEAETAKSAGADAPATKVTLSAEALKVVQGAEIGAARDERPRDTAPRRDDDERRVERHRDTPPPPPPFEERPRVERAAEPTRAEAPVERREPVSANDVAEAPPRVAPNAGIGREAPAASAEDAAPARPDVAPEPAPPPPPEDEAAPAWTPPREAAESSTDAARLRAADRTREEAEAHPDEAGNRTREGARIDIQRSRDEVDAGRGVVVQARPNPTDVERAIMAYGR